MPGLLRSPVPGHVRRALRAPDNADGEPDALVIYTAQDLAWLRSMRVRLAVSEDSVDPDGMMMQSIIRRVQDEFVAGAQTRALDVYPQDLRIRLDDPDPVMQRIFLTCWWAPNVTDVSLVGGPGDGRELLVQDIRRPLVVQCMPDRMAAFRDPGAYTDSDLSASAEPDRVMYRVAGWNTDTRRWLMEVSP